MSDSLKSYAFIKIAFMITMSLPVACYSGNRVSCYKLKRLANNYIVNNKISGVGVYVQSPRLRHKKCYFFIGDIKKGSSKK